MILVRPPLSTHYWHSICLDIIMISFDPSPYRSEDLFVIATTIYSGYSLINVESRLLILKKKSPLHVYWFVRFFPPSTPRLLHLYTSFFQKIPPSTFIPISTAIREMRVIKLFWIHQNWQFVEKTETNRTKKRWLWKKSDLVNQLPN